MDEQEWLTTIDPDRLVHSLHARKAGDRKLRLFAVACCRLVWDCFTDAKCRAAVDVAERFADGAATHDELFAAAALLRPVLEEAPLNLLRVQAEAARAATRGPANFQADQATWGPAQVFTTHLAGSVPWGDWLATHWMEWESARDSKRAETARLFRHILGNPYRPYPARTSWPSSVVALAQTFYNGDPVAFALHDALLDAGHPDLAEHFRGPNEWHPRGCFALDILLGNR